MEPHQNAETSSSTSATRHSELHLPSKAAKRSRGLIACAECRRLKIRCDRQIPCSSCTKRGCASLCPNGTVPPGEGSRFVVAATDHLHRKLSKLEARMHALEDALSVTYGTKSDEIHPLLANPDEEEEPPLELEPQEDVKPSLPTHGTLHTDVGANGQFFGPSGGSESILYDNKETGQQPRDQRRAPPDLDPSYLPQDINEAYQAFPFSLHHRPRETTQASIECLLPPIERAIEYCEIFMEHLSWMFQIVTARQMLSELIPKIYKQTTDSYGPHDLALVLIVVAIGALVDLRQDPYSAEAQHYYRLAKAAVSLQPVLSEASVVSIKVIHLMSIYNGLSGKDDNLEQCYTLLNLAGQVAIRIGFHMDPSLWGFEGKEAYERRVYFWNLLQAQMWQSIVTGRPPPMLSTFIDCKLPTPEDETKYQAGEVPLGFGIWGMQSTLECLIPVMRKTLAVKAPSYESILELDSKIRIFVVPVAKENDDSTALSMRAFVQRHYGDLMLMYLHRAFFVNALYEEDPYSSTYSRSIECAYRAAVGILDATKDQLAKQPILCPRIWRIWSFAFSAAVIVGAAAIQQEKLRLSPSPIAQLKSTCEVFRTAAKVSNRAAAATPVLDAMLQQATGHNESIVIPKVHSIPPPPPSAPLSYHQPPLPPLSTPPARRQAATFADLYAGGMFHETPLPYDAPNMGSNDLAASVDDMWHGFMYNYTIVDSGPVRLDAQSSRYY